MQPDQPPEERRIHDSFVISGAALHGEELTPNVKINQALSHTAGRLIVCEVN